LEREGAEEGGEMQDKEGEEGWEEEEEEEGEEGGKGERWIMSCIAIEELCLLSPSCAPFYGLKRAKTSKQK